MFEVEGTRRVLASALALAFLAAFAAPSASLAAEPSGVVSLPGDAHVAQVVDVDGDDANELVRILNDGEVGHVVEVWGYDGGTWVRRGSAPIPELTRSGGDQRIVAGTDASALLLWRSDGRPRVLVIARWGVPGNDPDASACCIAVHELVWRGGATHLEELAVDGGMADYAQTLDLDADGTDELVRFVTSISGESTVLEVLRWDGSAFRSILREEGSGQHFGGALVGDTDGHAGDELLIGPTPEGDMRRIAWIDGGLMVEQAHLDLAGPTEAFVSAIVDGALVLTLPQELRIVRWLRGEGPITAAQLPGTEYPYAAAFGPAGLTGTLLAVQGPYTGPGSIPRLMVYDIGLNALGEIAPGASMERITDVIDTHTTSGTSFQRYLYPYTGVVPGAGPGTPFGFSWAGTLVEAAPGGGYETRPISPMVGLQPIGLAGDDDGWMAFSSGYFGGANIASLYSGMVPSGFGGITLVPLEELLGSAGAVPTIGLRDAVVVGEPAGGVTQLMAAGDGFEVIVGAQVGSWVAAWDGLTVTELTMAEAEATMQIAARRRQSDENQAIRASLLVVTPGGHATVVEWEGSFIREPVALSVRGRTDAFAFTATVDGTVGANATVTVDGRPVSVAEDGRFGTTVAAAPWPHSVVVAARDPLGNEVVERIEVVGLYDYRGLPWVGIAGATTLAAGAVLFVRIPKRRSYELPGIGDGRLEELDPIDGASLHGR